MRNLKGGHGDGCNFEDEDRFSQGRRMAHQAVMYGFLLCFASTSVATVMHYGLNMPAPYPLWSLPKLLGVSGGLLLVLGCVEMVRLKLRADTSLGAQGLLVERSLLSVCWALSVCLGLCSTVSARRLRCLSCWPCILVRFWPCSC